MKKEDLTDAVKFSNFVQRIKIKYWKTDEDYPYISANHLEHILLLVWNDLKTYEPKD